MKNKKEMLKNFKKWLKSNLIYKNLNYKNYKFYASDYAEEKTKDIIFNDTRIFMKQLIYNDILQIIQDYILKIREKNKIKIDNKFYYFKNKYFVNNKIILLFTNNKEELIKFILEY